jgi:adenylate cyclase
VRATGTALFTDLRAFTQFAEANQPGIVIDVLNRFLGEMTEAVLDHGGTLAEYTGDGLLGLFGVPIESADHADRALAAAREMLEVRLPRFNAGLAADHPGAHFGFGVGMSSGPMMSGHVGSDRRLQYTAVGDTVNTAARVETLTKEVGHCLLLSQATRDLLTDPPDDLVYVGERAVRGRRARARLWTVNGA